MNFLRRHPFASLLAALVLITAIDPLPALVDAVTGAPPGGAELVRPVGYLILAPLSDTLDAMTFLALDRAYAFLATWAIGLLVVGALWGGSWRRRVIRAITGLVCVLLLALATVYAPRPVPRLAVADSSVAVIDYHSHTGLSHDGRRGWTVADNARWHAAQGFTAAYITDHNLVYNVRVTDPISLLPGAEWSVYRQHVVALGETVPVNPGAYGHDTPAMLKLFADLHRLDALAIASLPEYWEHHREDIDQFVAAGVDGFEIVNCAPKGLAFPSDARGDIIDRAVLHDLLVTGASDNHGYGKVTCVWNITHPGARGLHANSVIARPIAMLQGDADTWDAGLTQPWYELRGLSWSERASWLTWLLVYLLYAGMPRRKGQGAGVGILARRVSLKTERPREAE